MDATIKIFAELQNGDIWGINDGKEVFGDEIARLLCGGVRDMVQNVKILVELSTAEYISVVIPNLATGKSFVKVVCMAPAHNFPEFSDAKSLSILDRGNSVVPLQRFELARGYPTLGKYSGACGRDVQPGFRMIVVGARLSDNSQ